MTQRERSGGGESNEEEMGRGKERRGKVSERLGESKCKQVMLRDGKVGSVCRTPGSLFI